MCPSPPWYTRKGQRADRNGKCVAGTGGLGVAHAGWCESVLSVLPRPVFPPSSPAFAPRRASRVVSDAWAHVPPPFYPPPTPPIRFLNSSFSPHLPPPLSSSSPPLPLPLLRGVLRSPALLYFERSFFLILRPPVAGPFPPSSPKPPRPQGMIRHPNELLSSTRLQNRCELTQGTIPPLSTPSLA